MEWAADVGKVWVEETALSETKKDLQGLVQGLVGSAPAA